MTNKQGDTHLHIHNKTVHTHTHAGLADVTPLCIMLAQQDSCQQPTHAVHPKAAGCTKQLSQSVTGTAASLATGVTPV
jgi:hypothetical protein